MTNDLKMNYLLKFKHLKENYNHRIFRNNLIL